MLTFTKWYEKAKFLRNRTIVAAAEFFILLLIVVIPTTYMKWRFACALVMLLVRFVFAGIRFLLKGKKVQGNVNKPARIICCVFSVMFLGISLVPSFIFSNYNGLEVTGEYEIGECSAILIDSRIEEFENDGSKREVPVHFYYPETKNVGGKSFPLVIFSHGAFGYYQSNTSTYMELAIVRKLIQFILIEGMVLTLVFQSPDLRAEKIEIVITVAVCIFVIFILTHVISWFQNYRSAKEITEELIRFQQNLK